MPALDYPNKFILCVLFARSQCSFHGAFLFLLLSHFFFSALTFICKPHSPCPDNCIFFFFFSFHLLIHFAFCNFIFHFFSSFNFTVTLVISHFYVYSIHYIHLYLIFVLFVFIIHYFFLFFCFFSFSFYDFQRSLIFIWKQWIIRRAYPKCVIDAGRCI